VLSVLQEYQEKTFSSTTFFQKKSQQHFLLIIAIIKKTADLIFSHFSEIKKNRYFI